MDLDKTVMDIVTQVCEELRQNLKENLASFALYGSAVRNDMVAGRSDLNVLIILEHSAPEAHRVIAELLVRYPSVAPFVLSKSELERSRTVFALKFNSIKRNYRIIYGEDFLADFSPSDELLRFLSEQSLRNLRLRIKNAYIRNYQKPERFGIFVMKNIPALFVSLSEILRCAGIDVPKDHAARPELIGKSMGTDASVLAELREAQRSPKFFSPDDAFRIHSEIFRLLSAAIEWVQKEWPLSSDVK